MLRRTLLRTSPHPNDPLLISATPNGNAASSTQPSFGLSGQKRHKRPLFMGILTEPCTFGTPTHIALLARIEGAF
jgi:hypothetical protein